MSLAHTSSPMRIALMEAMLPSKPYDIVLHDAPKSDVVLDHVINLVQYVKSTNDILIVDVFQNEKETSIGSTPQKDGEYKQTTVLGMITRSRSMFCDYTLQIHYNPARSVLVRNGELLHKNGLNGKEHIKTMRELGAEEQDLLTVLGFHANSGYSNFIIPFSLLPMSGSLLNNLNGNAEFPSTMLRES